MTLSTLIGLTGRKRSGKNTVGDVFQGGGYTQLSFAAPIKIMIAGLLSYQGVPAPTIREMLEGDLKEVPTKYLGGQSPRYAMQKLGTEWGRGEMKDSLWVDILMNARTQFEAVVVTDVRFPNEVEAIKAAGGEVYRINRPGLPAADCHLSEALIDGLDVDQEIHNTAASAQEFQDEVYSLFVDPASNQLTA
jgi:hypothetical protein